MELIEPSMRTFSFLLRLITTGLSSSSLLALGESSARGGGRKWISEMHVCSATRICEPIINLIAPWAPSSSLSLVEASKTYRSLARAGSARMAMMEGGGGKTYLASTSGLLCLSTT
jgi:hypothetical protein